MGSTVLDAQGTAGVIHFNVVSGGGEIAGFTLTGGAALHGGGIYLENGDAQVHHNLIVGNSATSRGAGVRATFGAPWIHHNVIWENFDAAPLDTADPHGVILEGTATGVVEHNLIGRSDGNGLLTSGSAAPLVRNNIMLENGIPGPPSRGRGMCWLSTTSPRITHNLFFANQVAALLFGGADHSGVGANSVSLSDVIDGNQDGDPLLVDPDGGDFALGAGSPAIDTGDPGAPLDPDGTIADTARSSSRRVSPTLRCRQPRTASCSSVSATRFAITPRSASRFPRRFSPVSPCTMSAVDPFGFWTPAVGRAAPTRSPGTGAMRRALTSQPASISCASKPRRCPAASLSCACVEPSGSRC